jgi:proteic killer suppression protein
MSAASKEELYIHHALHFEALRGDRNGQFSIKVNNQYRIIFTLHDTVENPIVTICNIEELSNHYD